MPSAERLRRARSFGGVALEYDRGRPGYPAEAIAWILGPRPLEVMDLGAGTGKLAEALVRAGHRVTAVEPLGEMRSLIARRLPGLRVLDGVAEQLPIADRSLDAVLAAASFHWFDHEAALGEVMRVLRPPGVLALLGNSFDTSQRWLARLREILGPATLGRPGHWPSPERLEGLFGEVEDREFPHVQEVDLVQLRDYASSRSGFAVLAPDERARRLDEIDRLWHSAPELAGAERARLRWITRVRRGVGIRA